MRLSGVLIFLAAFANACSGSEGNPDAATQNVQVVRAAVEGSEYIFTPATVQAGAPVRLVFDPGNLPGCSKSVTLPAYEITKTIAESDASIEFTPRTEGEIAVVCTMNMYRGTLVAE